MDLQKNGEEYELILDETIFHPQGGGQPSDEGTISSMDGQSVFKVHKVLPKGDTVIHYGKFEDSVTLYSCSLF
jgi:Ser-tRNA(Ala) deacylase AlaX